MNEETNGKELHGREDSNEANLSITDVQDMREKTPTAGCHVYVLLVHDSRRVHRQGPRDDEQHQLTTSSAGLCCSSFESRQEGRVVRPIDGFHDQGAEL